jgi:glycerophosphoryl diester phosphodiesterase
MRWGHTMFLVALWGCGTPDPGGTAIIGHGGLGSEGEHPMNSRESLARGLALGIAGVEIDVQLTADGVPVAFHGQDLRELTPCSGKVNAVSWADLRACPNTAEGDRPYPVVRLDSLLAELALAYPKASFTLDAKLFANGDWWSYLERFTDVLTALHKRPELRGRLLVECQVEDFLRLLQRKDPDLPLYLYTNDVDQGLARSNELGLMGITVDRSRIDAGQMKQARALGLQVTLFGAGDRWSHREALGLKPDRLQSDAPGLFSQK